MADAPGSAAEAPAAADEGGGRRTRLGRAALGERLDGLIYGTIVALSVVIAGSRTHPKDPGVIAALVAITTGVFWFAHVYAHALGSSVAQDRHLSLAEIRRIAYHERTIAEAAVPPVVALLLGAVGLLSAAAAVWGAVAAGFAVLAAQGIAFARVERLGSLAALGVVAANLALGVLLVGLKLAVGH